ncbi:MAG: UvrB/UvrC motif-containing protein [Clostridia bacterium]|nr:UvrB/UvrC motif-containing protein [Clostridia bacterium]
MNCEKCGKSKATVFYKENINGRVRELNLCARCTEQMRETGELEDFSSAFSDFASPLTGFEEGGPEDLFAPFPESRTQTTSVPDACTSCGSTLHDVISTGRFGCSSCYSAFREQLTDPALLLYGQVRHVGRTPRGYRLRKERALEISSLKQALAAAVKQENYEEAVGLRDRIRSLES